MRLPALILLAAAMTAPLRAQAPEFAAIRIKPDHADSGKSNLTPLRDGAFTASNKSLLALLAAAYDLSADRIVGPDWLDSYRFDIDANSPAGVPDSAFRPMLQSLLNSRFKVSARREMRDMPVYEIVVAKEGLKISHPGSSHPSPEVHTNIGGAIAGTGTMADLAKAMDYAAGRPVVDKTGLEGRYSYQLVYAPRREGQPPSGPAPDFFTAVRQQLGLELNPKVDRIEVLIVDHSERVPSEN